MMKIELNGLRTKGKSALVDDIDSDWLLDYSWHVSTKGYAARTIRISLKKWSHESMHRAYDSAAEIFHGEFANTNFPLEG